MRIKLTQKLTYLLAIAAFGVCGLTACNSDSGTADKGMASDSTKMTGTATVDSTAKDTTAMAAKPAMKKRKASIVIPPAGTDKMVKDDKGVYNRAEVMPEYPGGQNALSAYLNDHIDFSQTPITDNSASNIRVSFVVDENGKVMDAQVMGDQKPASGLNDQAIKAIGNMPAWTPGKVKGKNVKTRLELPIAFEVEP